jgi:hypothetical protein
MDSDQSFQGEFMLDGEETAGLSRVHFADPHIAGEHAANYLRPYRNGPQW